MTTGVLNCLKKQAELKMGKAIPSHTTFFYCFGGLTLILIMLQVVTGIAMLFFYVPDPSLALKSIETMSNEVWGGWFLRNGHRWGSTILVAMVFSHMAAVFYFKAYRSPRELTWISGVVQLLMVFLLLTTGILLPWDWRAYWSFALWMDYVETWPFVGEQLGNLLLDTFTLNRVYYTHVLALPALLGGMLIFHFRMVRKHGISEPL